APSRSSPRPSDERIQVREISLERFAPGAREAKLGPRDPPLEALGARDVVRVLELSRVDREIPVRGFEEPLQLREAERLVRGQRAHDPEPDALVDEPVEVGEARGRSAG